ncbi:MAG: methyltransferase domain-containing protein [Vicinamibacterales bacterium]
MRDWNADTYHRVSSPQLRWGLKVLDRLRLGGGERVLDVGCGTGRLTEHLAWRVPRGRVVGVDRSTNMLQAAHGYLSSLSNGRVVLTQADAARLPFTRVADAIFSTATFHWVLDHDALFASLLAALKPGGRLVAQCGGGPNIARLVARTSRMLAEPAWAPFFKGWTGPWLFADAATTARRLASAGFVAVDTSEEYAPVTFPSADAFKEFVSTVVCRPYLEQLPPDRHAAFMNALTDEYASDATPFELDYWRLNIAARRPA